MIVTLDLDLDLPLLAKQKAVLLDMQVRDQPGRLAEDAVEAIEGILSLIDGIQDECCEKYGHEAVYGSADWVIVDSQNGVVDRYYTTEEALADMTEEMMEQGFAILHSPDPGTL